MKLYILLIIIISFDLQLFAQQTSMTPDERQLFIAINSMRKDKKIAALRFSPKLYTLAKKHSKEMSTRGNIKNKDIIESDNTIINIRSILGNGTNYIKQAEKTIRKNSKYYYTILNSNVKESAVAIEYNKKLGLYYISHVLKRGNLYNDSYYLQEKEFDKLLSTLDLKGYLNNINKIRFNLNRVSVMQRLKPFINHPKSIYFAKLSAGSIIIYLKDSHFPKNYLKISFSGISETFTGVYNITYYFKERSFLKEYNLLKNMFGLKKAIPTTWNGHPYHFRVENNKLKFYIHIMNDIKKQAYWITEDKIIKFRWQGNNGIYVSVTKTDYPYHYINLFKSQYGLKYPIRKQVYLRLLAEHLTQNDNFNIIDFLKNYSIIFYGLYKEETISLKKDPSAFKLNYLYYYKNGLQIRESLLKNGIIHNICKTSYNIKDKLVSIELKKGDNK